MLIWCSKCLRFVGEAYPYDKLFVAYAVCPRCSKKPDISSMSEHTGRQVLLDIYARLTDAGRRNDLEAAEPIIEEGAKAGVRPIDILFGVIAPMLYQAGEDWERGTFTVAEEHRLTGFCEGVVTMISERVSFGARPAAAHPHTTETLLMNARGNTHTIALRILALKLRSEGVQVQTLEMPSSLEELMAVLERTRPGRVLISMALAEQSESVISFVKRVEEAPEVFRPRIIIGGYSVKSGLVTGIPGADLITDINSL